MGIIDADHKQHKSVNDLLTPQISTDTSAVFQQSAGKMSVCQGDLIAMDTGLSTLTGVRVTLFSVMFTVMSTPISERLNTPLSPPTTAYEGSYVFIAVILIPLAWSTLSFVLIDWRKNTSCYL